MYIHLYIHAYIYLCIYLHTADLGSDETEGRVDIFKSIFVDLAVLIPGAGFWL
jgi:hypothetical protein